MAGSITAAYNAIIDACNDPNIGYWASNPQRTSIKLGSSTRTYCDCSSLMAWGLTQGGFYSTCPWFGTTQEEQYLTQIGFSKMSANTRWQAGDILWRTGHTEMVYEASSTGGRTMGAHNGDYPFPRQVSINTYNSKPSDWEYLFRSPDGEVPTAGSWAQGDGGFFELTDAEQYQNAMNVYYYFSGRGWTDAACAGVMGNINHESSFDPNIWLNGQIGSAAYGLIGFNPSSQLIAMRDADGIDGENPDENGPWQLSVMYEGRWGYAPTREYPYTLEEYGQIQDVEIAVRAYYANQERGGPAQFNTQPEFARYWLNEIINNFPSDPGNPPEERRQGAIDWELRRRLVKPF